MSGAAAIQLPASTNTRESASGRTEASLSSTTASSSSATNSLPRKPLHTNISRFNSPLPDTSIVVERRLATTQPIIDFPSQISPPSAKTTLLAEWNGCVTEIDKSGVFFFAALKGVVGEGVAGEEEDATIPISDVGEWDLELLKPGNFFRLCVVYEILPTGQPRRYTQVVFRRMPSYRHHDLAVAAERGQARARALRVE